MEYLKQIEGVSYDSLIGGTTVPKITANVSIAAGEFKRGELLAETGGLYDSATGSDSLKPLAIASSDIDSDDSRIATVYKTGEFNYSAIIAGSDVSLNAFEEQLRKDGIILTDIKGV